MTIEVTYIGHRGIEGHEYLYPAKWWSDFDTLDSAIMRLTNAGFLLKTGSYIPPSAIIKIKVAEK